MSGSYGQGTLLALAASSLLLLQEVGAVSLRQHGAPKLALQGGPSNGCRPGQQSIPATQFLETAPASHYDGFSRVACEVDISPASVRINFKEHACGELASCRMLELPMEPQLCFDFCRTQKSAKFFGLAHGRDCYCTTYFHAKSTGGQGTCDAHCEGNTKEMCGGMEKSSLFEMHMCADSVDQASAALTHSTAAQAEATKIAARATDTAEHLRAMAKKWELGVCSIVPEGQRVCGVTQGWLAEAAALGQAAAETGHATEVLKQTSGSLTALHSEAAGTELESTTAELAGKLEKTTVDVQRLASQAEGKAELATMALTHAGGPMAEEVTSEELKRVSSVFEALGNTDEKQTALCALEPIPGEAYGAMAEADVWSVCAKRCLLLSTGTGACVAFNYQWQGYQQGKFGAAACQLLKAEGLVEPMIAKAVPIFTVSEEKKWNLGLASLGCYAKGGWMAGHPRGPLGTQVEGKIALVDGESVTGEHPKVCQSC